MIYEWRVYHIMPGEMPNILARFRDVTMDLFAKHGMRVVGFWTTGIGDSSELVYLMAFDSLADRDTKWAAFQSDPDWLKARAKSEEGGPLVARVVNSILRPTDFSPLQ